MLTHTPLPPNALGNWLANFMQSKLFGIAAFAAMAAIDGSANASTFACSFPAVGRVIIATGKPKSITVYGEKKPAWSYDEIYETNGEFVVAYDAAKKTWQILPDEEPATGCKRAR